MGHLGRYQLIGRLATGGMAEVYLALSGELSGFRTLVVVKRILPHLASNHQFIRMFLDEARIAALLDHPNIVRIIEVGHDGDEYFLVMELVQGKPLSSVVRKAAKEKSPLTPALAAFVVAQAANGLGYAHNLADSDGHPLGVVHRDVSPQNILVSFEGAVKVIDFGIARALGRVTETSPGGLKGKIEYMSPEQASADEVDHRADVFALGVVLWEALTGRRLFRRETDLAIMRAIVDDPIPRPSEMLPVSPQLEGIVMRALHKRREERFQTAQEMALALERYAFASEGFSPLQLATYMKGLFDTEYAQWKKTVSSALEMESNSPGRLQSGTRFPVIQRPDLPTRGPTVALRKAGHSSIDTAIVGDPTSDSRIAAESISGAPTRRDRMWVYGGLAAVVAICATGALVLSQPRLGSTVRPAAPIPPRVMLATPPTPAPPAPPPPAAQVAAPAAPTAAPAAPAPAAGEAAETPPPSGAAEGGEPAGTAAGRAAADDPRGARASGSGKSRGHSSRGSGRPRGRGRGDGESDEAAPAVDRPPPVLQDHRPNPFD